MRSWSFAVCVYLPHMVMTIGCFCHGFHCVRFLSPKFTCLYFNDMRRLRLPLN